VLAYVDLDKYFKDHTRGPVRQLGISYSISLE